MQAGKIYKVCISKEDVILQKSRSLAGLKSVGSKEQDGDVVKCFNVGAERDCRQVANYSWWNPVNADLSLLPVELMDAEKLQERCSPSLDNHQMHFSTNHVCLAALVRCCSAFERGSQGV